MKFLLPALAAFTLLSFPAKAVHLPDPHSHDVEIQVNGLVCDFCARALEKVFGKRDEVENIYVNLDKHMVAVDLKDGADIPDAELTSMINDSGYNTVEITRH